MERKGERERTSKEEKSERWRRGKKIKREEKREYSRAIVPALFTKGLDLWRIRWEKTLSGVYNIINRQTGILLSRAFILMLYARRVESKKRDRTTVDRDPWSISDSFRILSPDLAERWSMKIRWTFMSTIDQDDRLLKIIFYNLDPSSCL